MQSGIYKITIGEKFYIGSSSKLKNRRATHLRSLKKGEHRNRFMQRAYDKSKSFHFVIIQLADVNSLESLEQEYINKHYDQKDCMNISRSSVSYGRTPEGKKMLADLNRSRVWTDEQRARISKAKKGKKYPMPEYLKKRYKGAGNPNSKLSDSQIKEIVSKRKAGGLVVDLANHYEVDRSTIQRALKANGVKPIYPKTWTAKMRKAQMAKTWKRGKPFKKGDLPPITKLTESDVFYALDQIHSGANMAEVARKLKVSPEAIYAIKQKRTWKKVIQKWASLKSDL